MISATEARKNAEQFNEAEDTRKNSLANKFIDEHVAPAVLKASNEGKFDCTISLHACNGFQAKVFAILSDAGYKVQCLRGATDATISW